MNLTHWFASATSRSASAQLSQSLATFGSARGFVAQWNRLFDATAAVSAFRMKLDRSERYFRIDIIRLDGQCAMQHGHFVSVAPEKSVTDGNLLQQREKLRGSRSIARSGFVWILPNAPGASVCEPCTANTLGLFGRASAGKFQFSQRRRHNRSILK